MPLFERDTSSNTAADEAAARIAELVRRTAERDARPGPSAVVRPERTIEQPYAPVPATPIAQPNARPAIRPVPSRVRIAMRQASPRLLASLGALVAVVMVAGSLALSRPDSPDAEQASPSPTSAAPAGYAVKVTDVITDCSSHSRGRTKISFEAQNCVKATRSLASGKVSGRSTLFVTSRIEMASAEAAASVKQVLDGTGTGNLNDLLREGMTFPGAPGGMPDSGYASVQTGPVVLVAEAGFVDGGESSNTDPALRAAAAQVAALINSQS